MVGDPLMEIPAAVFRNSGGHRESSDGLYRRDAPTTAPEDIRCRGRDFGTCFDEIPPDSERGRYSTAETNR
jgi:hypothetical protein